jgi:hypothetical protein
MIVIVILIGFEPMITIEIRIRIKTTKNRVAEWTRL